jgi:hypothetical protein
MLDLDSLAEKRARLLQQKDEDWRKALWSPAFQKISQTMTDGEIEGLLGHCTSPQQLDLILKFLQAHPDIGSTPSYALLEREAREAGIGLADWIQILVADEERGQ